MKSNHVRDTLFASPLGEVAGFSFDEKVAEVFPDMLNRSIPGYQSIIAQTGLLAARHAQAGTHCYDLGTSLGATAFAMQQHIPHKDCRIIATDNSPAMTRRLRERLLNQPQIPTQAPIEVRCEDIRDSDISHASVVALNFTLQFIDPADRQPLMTRIASAMVDGGVLILSEKVCFDDDRTQALFTDMYYAFKQANGYSELEISQKRTALENVLVPDTLQQHQHRLSEAGFSRASVWFQCFNFASIIAVK